jgi:hypothetical protein
MIIDILDIEVPGTPLVAARRQARGVLSFFTGSWSEATRGAWRRPAASSFTLYPLGAGQGVTRSTRVHAYLSALGNSSGEAFDIHIVNDGTAPVRIGGDGIVVEPVKKNADGPIRAEIQRVATRQNGVQSVRANAYCLDYKLKPPANGTLFRVVDPKTQDQYRPAREILRASRRLQEAGQLQPDSNPTEYFHSIKQWAIWVDKERFTLAKYQNAFVEHTKKTMAAAGRRWSKQFEDALKAIVPHRWSEITKILVEAKQPVPQ